MVGKEQKGWDESIMISPQKKKESDFKVKAAEEVKVASTEKKVDVRKFFDLVSKA